MNKREAYRLGVEAGYNCASWQNLPEIGYRVDPSIDWQGIGDTIQDKGQAGEYFAMVCHEAESNSRQYSPFEDLAHEFNSAGEWRSDALWAEYDRGIERGIYINWRERSKDYYKAR